MSNIRHAGCMGILNPFGLLQRSTTTQVKQRELQEQLCKLQVRVVPHKMLSGRPVASHKTIQNAM